MATLDIFQEFFTQLDHFNIIFGICSCLTGILLIIVCKYTFPLENSNRSKPAFYSSAQCHNPNCVRCAAKETLSLAIQDKMKCYIGVMPTNTAELPDRIVRSFKHHLTLTNDKTNKTGQYQNVGAEKFQNPSIFYLQSLSSVHHFKDLEGYPEYEQMTLLMKMSFGEVKQEFDVLWNNFVEDFDEEGWQENHLPGDESGGKWFAFHLINQGRRQTENLRKCPVTSDLIEKVERLMLTDCIFGFATFSVLMPGTHIISHCGATNVRLRCHLGLNIPKGCMLTVNDEEFSWSEGECLMFDDSFQHEAWHHGSVSSGPRSVLMIDFWHPDLSKQEQVVLERTFHSDLLNL